MFGASRYIYGIAILIVIRIALAQTTFNFDNAQPQTYLNGKVTDLQGTPIADAKLWVIKYDDINAYSDENGNYQFPKLPDVGIENVFRKQTDAKPFIFANTLHFTLTSEVSVKCELFDICGRRVRTLLEGTVAAKKYAIRLSALPLPVSTYIISLKIGTSDYIQRIVIHDNGRVAVAGRTTEINPTSKQYIGQQGDEAYIDDLICSKNGYENVTIPITSYHATVNIIMETEDTVPPVITVLGGDTIRIPYTDTATLNSYWHDYRIEITDDRDTAPRFYPPTNLLIPQNRTCFAVMTYKASDKSGNLGVAYRYFILYDSTITDTVPPEITVVPDTIVLFSGEIFQDTGVSAYDEVDSIFTGTIMKSGEVNTSVPGTYTITYRVIDTSMNEGIATRVVIIKERELNTGPE